MSKGFASNYRIALIALGVVCGFCAVGVRLVFLHVIERDRYLPDIDKARRQIIVETARRGDILDARGNILATSRPFIVLGVDPQSLRAGDEKKWPALAALTGIPLEKLRLVFTTKTRPAAAPARAADAPLFSFTPTSAPAKPADAAEAEEDDDDTETDDTPAANGERKIRWAKLSENVSEETYAKIQKLDLKGVYGTRVYRRAYPHHALAAHLIGYVNKAGTAVAGLERYADFYLRGRDGWREGERDGKGREVVQFRTREVPPADGYSVTLSIDNTVQHIVESELEYLAQKYEPEKATIIVSDPRTGFILGLGNYPTFDPNDYNKIPKIEQGVMRNIAVADMYEPGSCFKIVAASAGLNENLVTPGSTFDCSLDRVEYRGKVRGLPKEDHHFGMLSVAEIIAHSSNRGAAQIAMLMGEEKFYDYARAFGFGQLSGFPVGGEIDGAMAEPPALRGDRPLRRGEPPWDGLTITRMPMGHSIAATPMQMQMAMGTIASGGLLLRPQLIREIRDASGEIVYRYDAVAKRRAISEPTARLMAKLLMAVASKEGTAPEAAIPNYEVAGKTGTTQKLVNGRYSEKQHVASFIGFFPASRPRVAISVIVDGADARAPGGVAYGSKVSAPSFKRIGEQLIQYLDIKPVYSAAASPAIVMGGSSR